MYYIQTYFKNLKSEVQLKVNVVSFNMKKYIQVEKLAI